MRLSALTAITVPDIGDFTHIPVIEILVKAGDRVRPRETLHWKTPAYMLGSSVSMTH